MPIDPNEQYGHGNGPPPRRGVQPSRPPRRVGVPARTPDYGAILRGSSGYLGRKADWDRRRAGAASSRREAIRNLILQFGGLGGIADQFGDLDPALLELARNNQNSQTAQLQDAYGKQLLQRRQSTVSRGMENSGEMGHEESQAAQWRSGEEYRLGQALLAAAQGIYGDYTGTMSGIDTEETGYLTDPAVMEAITEANPATPASTAKLDQGLSASYGYPVYRGADGKKYRVGPDGVPQEIVTSPQMERVRRGLARRARARIHR